MHVNENEQIAPCPAMNDVNAALSTRNINLVTQDFGESSVELEHQRATWERTGVLLPIVFDYHLAVLGVPGIVGKIFQCRVDLFDTIEHFLKRSNFVSVLFREPNVPYRVMTKKYTNRIRASCDYRAQAAVAKNRTFEEIWRGARRDDIVTRRYGQGVDGWKGLHRNASVGYRCG
jgi:hypothetical protein